MAQDATQSTIQRPIIQQFIIQQAMQQQSIAEVIQVIIIPTLKKKNQTHNPQPKKTDQNHISTTTQIIHLK